MQRPKSCGVTAARMCFEAREFVWNIDREDNLEGFIRRQDFNTEVCTWRNILV